jgi:hypothetical protein
MAKRVKTGTELRPKSTNDLDRPPMVSVKTKKAKKTSRGK